MSKVDPRDNIRFLVVCINHTSNGKPNFETVAQELNIVSKGAASKRYERLLKANNVSTSGKVTGAAPVAAVAAPAPAAPPAAVSEDDEDEEPAPKPTKKRKPLVMSSPKEKVAKKAKIAAPRAAPKTKVKVKAKVKVESESSDEKDDEDDKVAIKDESDSSLSDAPADIVKDGEI